MSLSNLFPIKFWKFLVGCFDSKLLQIIIGHLLKSVNKKSELSSHQMYSKMFSKGRLISILAKFQSDQKFIS